MTNKKQYKVEREILESFVPQWVKNITIKPNRKTRRQEKKYRKIRGW